jgi:NADH:ubiquinone oxidoreductase subunit F (NADH-binding)
MSLRTIVLDIGGGIRHGGKLKAVQTGGPSGGCLPLSKFNLSVDFDSLAKAGSMLGSGGIVAMGCDTCMVDVAKRSLQFLQNESCGKCTSCRSGLARMLELVTDITEGRGRSEQLGLLEELGKFEGDASSCALGKAASNPVLSTLRYFRNEYDAHIQDGRCPAGVCRALVRYTIREKQCNGCGLCREVCPHRAITGANDQPHTINPNACTKCGICRDTCTFGAVTVV